MAKSQLAAAKKYRAVPQRAFSSTISDSVVTVAWLECSSKWIFNCFVCFFSRFFVRIDLMELGLQERRKVSVRGGLW